MFTDGVDVILHGGTRMIRTRYAAVPYFLKAAKRGEPRWIDARNKRM